LETARDARVFWKAELAQIGAAVLSSDVATLCDRRGILVAPEMQVFVERASSPR